MNISGTNANICEQQKAFSFFHGILNYTLKKSTGINLIIVPLELYFALSFTPLVLLAMLYSCPQVDK